MPHGVDTGGAPQQWLKNQLSRRLRPSLNHQQTFTRLQPTFMRLGRVPHTLPAVLKTQPGEPQ
jgi:hypothetical protein